MHLAEILLEPQPSPTWLQLRQIGIDHAVGVLPRAAVDWRGGRAEHPWDYTPLALYKQMVEDAGFTLAVIEDNPPMDAIRLGRPGAEEELEYICTLLRNMGRLGIPVLCYNWMAVTTWLRTSVGRTGRAGAVVSGFDASVLEDAPLTHAGAIPEELLWKTLGGFLDRVVPVADEAGVKLALHPDDPPLSPVQGVGRIMRTVDAFERLLALNPSDANGLTLCQGNFALMTDDLPGAIRQLGASGRVHYVHFRDVAGTADSFVETFHDEGPTDMYACMRAYREIGFSGVMRSDHSPTLAGDSATMPGYPTLGRLYAVGYMTGLREAALRDS